MCFEVTSNYREGLEAPFPPYGLSIYGLSEHFEGEGEMFSINGV